MIVWFYSVDLTRTDDRQDGAVAFLACWFIEHGWGICRNHHRSQGFKSARVSMNCLEFTVMMCPMRMHMMSATSKKDRSLAMDARIRQAYISILYRLYTTMIGGSFHPETRVVKFQKVFRHFYTFMTFPFASKYGIFTYIYHENQSNVGKYTIHGWYGFYNHPVDIMYMKHLSPAPLAPYDISKAIFCPGVWGYHLRLCACQPISGLGSIPVTWRFKVTKAIRRVLVFGTAIAFCIFCCVQLNLFWHYAFNIFPDVFELDCWEPLAERVEFEEHICFHQTRSSQD